MMSSDEARPRSEWPAPGLLWVRSRPGRSVPIARGSNSGDQHMFPGWISLRVQDPKAVSEWYTDHLGLVVFGGRKDIGSVALGTGDHGAAIILLPGDPLEHPERLQMHFHVPDVDAEYERLKREGVYHRGSAAWPWTTPASASARPDRDTVS